MTADTGSDALFYLLLLILPVAALVTRRVPVSRTLVMAASWAAIFVVLIAIVSQRDRFDPYIQRIAGILQIGDQRVVGRQVRISMAEDGHFWASVSVDGVRRRMLVDSGATVTALSTATATEARLKIGDSVFPMLLSTANGTVSAQTATVGRFQLGDIFARDLGVVVSPAFGDTDVLGMNFLSKLKSWRVEGRTLILEPHNG